MAKESLHFHSDYLANQIYLITYMIDSNYDFTIKMHFLYVHDEKMHFGFFKIKFIDLNLFLIKMLKIPTSIIYTSRNTLLKSHLIKLKLIYT